MDFLTPVKALKNGAANQIRLILPRLRPSAICIGAQKAGTTALFEYLSHHPQVASSRIKEIDFFNCDSRYRRGVRFYHSHFPLRTLATRDKLTFDITPGYLGLSEAMAKQSAERIYAYDPTMKLLALLRNPITRAHSAWQMYRSRVPQNPNWFADWMRRCDSSVPVDFFVARPSSFGESFEQDIRDEIEAIERGRTIAMPILAQGMYYPLISFFFNSFPRDQIVVIASEDLRRDTLAQLRRIEAFVGLQSYHRSEAELAPRFEGAYQEDISVSAYRILESYYRQPNRALFSLLGREFAWDRSAVARG
jgi:hypothetical protein